MPFTIANPYLDTSTTPWWRANLHTHTSRSDGADPPQEVVDDYASRGYDVLMLSDHDLLTSPSDIDHRGMLLIPGNEVSTAGPHVLHIDAHTLVSPDPERQGVLDAIVDDGGLAVLCHPNWQADHDHYPQPLLARLRAYLGIEIYNAVLRRSTGAPLATDRWDTLLTAGKRVWGFAHDDAHVGGDRGLAWIMLHAPTRSREAILSALRDGRFYASTGLALTHVGVAGGAITVTAAGAQSVVAIGDEGRRLASTGGDSLTVRLEDGDPWTYVRFECWGAGEAMAWTQPFFITASDRS